MVPMTKKRLLELMKKYKPTTPQEVEHVLGTKLKFIGSGCFREVYLPKRCLKVVIKFPLQSDLMVGYIHACAEERRIKKLRRIKELKHHIPEVLYFDKKFGITVLPYVPSPYSDELYAVYGLLSKLIRRIGKTNLRDIYGNVGMDNRGRIVILDVGY